MPDDHEAYRRQRAQIRNQYLRRLADADPTLTRLKAALEEERRWQAMTTAELLTVVEQLEVKYRQQGETPLGTA
jgi:hypothetical protein